MLQEMERLVEWDSSMDKKTEAWILNARIIRRCDVIRSKISTLWFRDYQLSIASEIVFYYCT